LKSIVVCRGVGSARCTAQAASAGYPGQAKIVLRAEELYPVTVMELKGAKA